MVLDKNDIEQPGNENPAAPLKILLLLMNKHDVEKVTLEFTKNGEWAITGIIGTKDLQTAIEFNIEVGKELGSDFMCVGLRKR